MRRARKVDDRLAKLMAEPGGLRVADALRRADERLVTVRKACITVVDSQIATLDAFVHARDGETAPSAYHAAREVFALAGTHGLTELSAAALSLCDVLAKDRSAADPRFWERVRVHVDAMRKLRHPAIESDAAARATILEGLRKVAAQARDAE
ncbi:MAG: hypothetical protein K2P58_12950 [Hyphomonadaceae bacterium]|nr:hypothetical protein [Hyphomonadaceae bacterium]